MHILPVANLNNTSHCNEFVRQISYNVELSEIHCCLN